MKKISACTDFFVFAAYIQRIFPRQCEGVRQITNPLYDPPLEYACRLFERLNTLTCGPLNVKLDGWNGGNSGNSAWTIHDFNKLCRPYIVNGTVALLSPNTTSGNDGEST